MTPDELAELEVHLAAGTDLPTAMAAVDRRPGPRRSTGLWLIAFGIAILAWWLLG